MSDLIWDAFMYATVGVISLRFMMVAAHTIGLIFQGVAVLNGGTVSFIN